MGEAAHADGMQRLHAAAIAPTIMLIERLVCLFSGFLKGFIAISSSSILKLMTLYLQCAANEAASISCSPIITRD
jgi:hypothetical protein